MAVVEIDREARCLIRSAKISDASTGGVTRRAAIRLLDGSRAYLHAVIDNFTRRILAWKVSASQLLPRRSTEAEYDARGAATFTSRTRCLDFGEQ